MRNIQHDSVTLYFDKSNEDFTLIQTLKIKNWLDMSSIENLEDVFKIKFAYGVEENGVPVYEWREEFDGNVEYCVPILDVESNRQLSKATFSVKSTTRKGNSKDVFYLNSKKRSEKYFDF